MTWQPIWYVDRNGVARPWLDAPEPGASAVPSMELPRIMPGDEGNPVMAVVVLLVVLAAVGLAVIDGCRSASSPPRCTVGGNPSRSITIPKTPTPLPSRYPTVYDFRPGAFTDAQRDSRAARHVNRGIGYLGLGDAEAAVRQFDLAVLLKNDHPDAYVLRWLAHCCLGNEAEAARDWAKAREMGTDPVPHAVQTIVRKRLTEQVQNSAECVSQTAGVLP